MADGSQKRIEDVKEGDQVMSRNEAAGTDEVATVKQTFKRQAATTLLLTLSNREKIETTKEHPFYVTGKGFIKAGELGIGTSIVTRAGPVTLIQREGAIPRSLLRILTDFVLACECGRFRSHSRNPA